MTQRKPPSVAMFSAEAVPYAKVGGLADVVGALPGALGDLGVEPSLIIPGYRAIPFEEHDIHPYDALPGFEVPMGPRSARAEIYHARIPGTRIDAFFIVSGDYFARDGIYDDPATKKGFPDNMERFVFFMKAGIELLSRLGRPVDVLHCHDWQTALIPGLMATGLRENPFFARTGSLFTIHNMAYQGLHPKEALQLAGIDYSHFFPASPFEFWGKVNFMKVGIECADLINTVSETYALEIQSSPEYGCGLEEVLRRRKGDFSGIVNGVDYVQWNPESDAFIASPFCAQDLSGKSRCKAALLEYFKFPHSSADIPLIGMVSRLADQKGFDLVAEAAAELAGLDLRLVVLGYGQEEYHGLIRRLSESHPQKIAAKIEFDNRLAHQIFAGSDMLLIPSKFEPCGLSQLIAKRYGTIPIVRATGGLADTVVDYDPQTGDGTGFRFGDYRAREMVLAVRRALNTYSDAPRWLELIRRSMAEDWSWKKSACKYVSLYREIRARRDPQIAGKAY